MSTRQPIHEGNLIIHINVVNGISEQMKLECGSCESA